MPFKKIFPTNPVLMTIVSLLLAACSYPYGTDVPPPEFAAQLADFENYKTWDSIDYTIGASNPAIGTFHSASKDDYSRKIYMYKAGELSENKYPAGTVFVMETFTWAGGMKKFAASGGLLAMVKRGGNFNAAQGGWEWFDLSTDLSSIAARGIDVINGGCSSCHGLAAQQTGGVDYVFPHPAEVVAAADDFAGYAGWTKIDENSGANPLLGAVHKSDDNLAVRRIYKKQILANPDTAAQGYPVGTIIVQEVEQGVAVMEITAMVKRGGDFNGNNANWEWFLLTPGAPGILNRGADLVGGICNNCHTQATLSANGRDYVFRHGQDPFTGKSAPPIADAGPDQQAVIGGPVTLDGSGSFSGAGDSLVYKWSFTSRPAGSAASLSSDNAVNPTFVADLEGSYVLQLVVTDRSGTSLTDTVVITSAAAIAGVSFAKDIQPIFDGNCLSCHPSLAPSDLSSGSSYDSLVNQPAVNPPNTTRVIAGDSANSELYLRVTGASTGAKMPLGGSLSTAQQNLIKTWINEGAKNN